MTDNEIIKAVAELDGWVRFIEPRNPGDRWMGRKAETDWILLPDYLTSRDAIVPVIDHQTNGVKEEIIRLLSLTIYEGKSSGLWACDVLCSSPRQLCIALLRATGKWKE